MRRTPLLSALIAGLVSFASWSVQSETRQQGKSEQKKEGRAAAKPAADQRADETAIRQNVQAFANAVNAQDAGAAAVSFTTTGEFVDGDGNVFHGRAAIEAEFAALFQANPKGHIEITATELRAIAPGIVMEEGTATIGPADKSSAATVGYTIVHAKQADGKWLMASVRSKGDETTSPHEQLRQLEWLIGEWVDESDDAIVRTSARWSEDKNFIMSDFHIDIAGLRAMSGTTRIGWDASIGRFRSWVFDSAGGHATGLWSQVGDRWVVKVTGVRADGAVGTATNVFIPSADGSITLTSIDRIVGDVAGPDTTVKMVRRPPDPRKQPVQ
jgi:uncharacterized protein (TIGR02246 family)